MRTELHTDKRETLISAKPLSYQQKHLGLVKRYSRKLQKLVLVSYLVLARYTCKQFTVYNLQLTLGPSMLRIHFHAWHWGSMINGQREPRLMMIPFSVLNESVGSPWMFHSRIVVGSDRNSTTLNPGDTGTSVSATYKFWNSQIK